jgi:hypothetical protein
MRSPFVGLLLQHGHVHDPELARHLGRDDRPPLRLGEAIKRLATQDAAPRGSWRAATSASRYLFLINSP